VGKFLYSERDLPEVSNGIRKLFLRNIKVKLISLAEGKSTSIVLFLRYGTNNTLIMRLTNYEIARIVYFAFKKAFEEKDNEYLMGNNPFRSSYFVSLIGDKLKEHYTDAVTHYQAIDSIDKKKKRKGEWLFDICVTSQLMLVDHRHKDGIALIDTNILFACESEFSTGINDFATDFGKLICSNANQYLFIQGLNQSTESGRNDFVSNRKEIIRNQLKDFIQDDFVIAFIPTPGKMGERSFWDTYENEVFKWASIWMYDVSKNDFVEFINN